MKRTTVVRISAGAKPGTPGWLAEGLRQIADEIEEGKINAIAICWTSSNGKHIGDWWDVVDNGSPNLPALIGACCVLRSDMEHEILAKGRMVSPEPTEPAPEEETDD